MKISEYKYLNDLKNEFEQNFIKIYLFILNYFKLARLV